MCSLEAERSIKIKCTLYKIHLQLDTCSHTILDYYSFLYHCRCTPKIWSVYWEKISIYKVEERGRKKERRRLNTFADFDADGARCCLRKESNILILISLLPHAIGVYKRSYSSSIFFFSLSLSLSIILHVNVH